MNKANHENIEIIKGTTTPSDVGMEMQMQTRRTSYLAMVSFSCAVAAIILFSIDIMILEIHDPFLFVLAIFLGGIAFVLGLISRTIIFFNKGKLKGLACSITAIVLGTPFILFIASGIYVNWGRARAEKPGKARILGFAILRYAKEENGGYLPDAEKWCDTVLKYSKTVYESAFSYRSSEPGVYNYAFNRNLSGLKLDNITKNTVLIFESEGGWNLSGTEELLFKAPKKRQYVHTYCGSADIRPIHVQDEAYKSVHWKP